MKKVLKWIGIVFVVLVIISAVGSGGDKKETATQTASSSDSKSDAAETNSTKQTDAKQEEPEEKEEQEKQEEIKNKYNVGDTWENKYVLVSYDDCGEYISDNQFIQPSEGNKYIYAAFTFENVGKSDTTVGYWDFDCYADGYACDAMYMADGAGFTQTLSSGRKISGSVYFEVPNDAEEIEFEYSPNFWTSEKIVFVYQ